MLLRDLDQYYTPTDLARSVVEISGLEHTANCLDAACGDGSLLLAARDVFSDVQCLGIDVDASTISRLRKRYPSWILSHANALADSAWHRAKAGRHSIGCDLVLLNPPFSMGARKGINVDSGGFNGRCSVAMAHILMVLMKARPNMGCAIVPESLLFSDMDEKARRFLSNYYAIRPIRSLRSSTFRGGHANASVIKMERVVKLEESIAVQEVQELRGLRIVRGGLPYFEAAKHQAGATYVHSTDLRSLAAGHIPLRRVKPIARGLVSGNVILLPRVGLPHSNSIRCLKLNRVVQLSDCVIALCCKSRTYGNKWQKKLTDRWDELLALYRGTGARYITVHRLHSWLEAIS